MKLHAIQTGSVRIKTAQVQGQGHGLRRRIGVFADRDWTGWLPTYVWLIDHPEGVIVVDTGQGTHLLETARSLHLHIDHDGGLAHFQHSDILASRGELRTASGWMGRMRGYLPNRWPSWFNPVPLDLAGEPFGPFPASRPLTAAGDVVAVATPGHTADHLSVIVEDEGITYMLAGDTSYNERLMLAGEIDGVCADEAVSRATLRAIRALAKDRPTVYLPTHDPESAARLSSRRLVDVKGVVSESRREPRAGEDRHPH